MFIKSTNENLFTMDHVYDSLYNHLGLEYKDSVQQIFEQSVLKSNEYITLEKKFEDMEEEYQKELVYWENKNADKQQAIFDVIHTIEKMPRLNKQKIINLIKNCIDK